MKTDSLNCLSEEEIEMIGRWFRFAVGDIYQPSKDEWKLAEKLGFYKPTNGENSR